MGNGVNKSMHLYFLRNKNIGLVQNIGAEVKDQHNVIEGSSGSSMASSPTDVLVYMSLCKVKSADKISFLAQFFST